MRPRVSIVIPARNEADDIVHCLEAVAAQGFDARELEVIVVDGWSSDETAELATDFLGSTRFGSFRVLANPAGTTPSSLNVGLKAAEGEYLVRVDARSLIPKDYVRSVVDLLESRPDVAVTGGAQRAVARDSSPRGVGIARSLNNRWSTGLARYRRTAESGPADTVYLGAFRTADLREVGGWDERFPTNQDFDLNRRMSRRGTLWFLGDLAVDYRPRATYRQLGRQYYRFGRWKATYWRVTGDKPRPRQLAILLVPTVAAASTVATSIRRRSVCPLLAAGIVGVAAAFGIERRGASTPPADVRGHVGGVVGMFVTSASWLVGVYDGLIRGGLSRS